MSHPRYVLTRVFPAFAAIAALALFAVACSSSSSSKTPTVAIASPSSAASSAPSASPSSAASPASSPSASASSSTGAATTVEIAAEPGNKFDKDKLTVKAGAPITVKFTNNDPIIHNFSVYDKKGGTELFTGDLFKGPNVTKEEHFTAPAKPGDYYFQCDVHPDTMFGTLVVQ